MKTFQRWTEESYDEDWKKWVAGGLIGASMVPFYYIGKNKQDQMAAEKAAANKPAITRPADEMPKTLKDRSDAMDGKARPIIASKSEPIPFPTMDRKSVPPPPKVEVPEETPAPEIKVPPTVRREKGPVIPPTEIADEAPERVEIEHDKTPATKIEIHVIRGNPYVVPKDKMYLSTGGCVVGDRELSVAIKIARSQAVNGLLRNLKASNTHLRGKKDVKIWVKQGSVFVTISIPREGIEVDREMDGETGRYRESRSPRSFASYVTSRRRSQ